MEDKDLEKPEAAEETAVQPENGRALKEEPEKRRRCSHRKRWKKKEVHCDSTLCWSSWESCTEYLPLRQGKRDGSPRKFRIQCERTRTYHCQTGG